MTGTGAMDPAAYLALVIAVSVGCQWLAWQLRIPSILLLLVTGFGLGQLVDAEAVLGREVLFAGVTVTVGIILFEGSLSLRLREVRGIEGPVVRLCTVSVVIAWALTTLAGIAVGIDPPLALLVGAVLVVTGPTVINPILRQLRPARRLSSLLRWEAIVVDPVGAVLAVLVLQAVVDGGSGDTVGAIAVNLTVTVGVAFGLAGVLGLGLEQLVRRHVVPDFLHGVLFLAVAVGALVVSNLVQPESGLLTVTALGVLLGNRPALHLTHVREFKEHLQVLFVGALFVVLAGRVTPGQLGEVAPRAALLLLLLVVVVRPASVALGLLGTTATREERTLLAWMAPRGIVAAAVTSIFALELEAAAGHVREQALAAGGVEREGLAGRAERLDLLAAEAEALVPLVFLVIVGTVALYGLGVGRLAERLGLASTSPQGVVFVGAQTWVVQTAAVLAELDVPTLVVAKSYRDLARARMSDLTTEATNILSEYAVEDLDLGGMGTFVACTGDDETNGSAAREFRHILGSANVFQLRRGDAAEGARNARKGTADRLRARYPFAPAVTHDELDRLVEDGMVVKRTRLSAAFTLEDFRARNEDAVILFTHRDGTLSVVTEEGTLPERGTTLVALVRDTDPGLRKERNDRRKAAKAAGASRARAQEA